MGRFLSFLILFSIFTMSFAQDRFHYSKQVEFDNEARSATWITTVLDSNDQVGRRVSIELDQNENPGIAYSISSPRYIKFAKNNGAGWSIQNVKSFTRTNLDVALGFNSSNFPRIVWDDYYYDHTYSEWDGTSWQHQTFSTLPSQGDIFVDNSDIVHITWYTGSNLEYRRWDGVTWQTQIVDGAGDVGYGSRIVLDNLGRKYISYAQWGHALKFAYYNGSTWTPEIVDFSINDANGTHPIGLDNQNNPYILYTDSDQIAKIAKKINGQWQFINTPLVDPIGRKAGFVVDDNNQMHISCYQESGNLTYLRYYLYDGSNWNYVNIDSFVTSQISSYFSSDLVISMDMTIHIAYIDPVNLDLKYAVSTSANPLITLTSPDGGETWKVGTQENIIWTSTNVTAVDLEYTADNGSSWLPIASNIPASDGSYTWTIPNTPSSTCLVRITDSSNPTISDQCDNTFIIYSGIIPTQGLIAYYPFSGNANDESINNNNGTVNGAVLTADRFGNPNSAYLFDGANNYIDIGNDNSLKPPLPMTISAWIKSGVSGGNPIFTNNYHDNRYYGIYLNIDHLSNIRVEFGDGGLIGTQSRRSKSGTSTISPTTWYHVVGICRSATDMDIYINGVNDGGGYDGSGGPLAYSSGAGNIARKDNDANPGPPIYFTGVIDDIRFYDRALDEDEVISLFNEGPHPIVTINSIIPSTPTINDNIILSGVITFPDGTPYVPNFGEFGVEDPLGLSTSLISVNSDGTFSYSTSNAGQEPAGFYWFKFILDYGGTISFNNFKLSIEDPGIQFDGFADLNYRMSMYNDYSDLPPWEDVFLYRYGPTPSVDNIKNVGVSFYKIFSNSLRLTFEDFWSNDINRAVVALTVPSCLLLPLLPNPICVWGVGYTISSLQKSALFQLMDLIIDNVPEWTPAEKAQAKDISRALTHSISFGANLHDGGIKNIVDAQLDLANLSLLIFDVANEERNKLRNNEIDGFILQGVDQNGDVWHIGVGRISKNSIYFSSWSPVDIRVTDPIGRIVEKGFSQILDAQYVEDDFNGDGEIDDRIFIPEYIIGDYNLIVIPDSSAALTDKVTITAGGSWVDTTIVFADKIMIQDLPPGGYDIASEIRNVSGRFWFSSDSIHFVPGGVIDAYLELPNGYDVSLLNTLDVTLNNILVPIQIDTTLLDTNSNGILERRMVFSQDSLLNLFMQTGEQFSLEAFYDSLNMIMALDTLVLITQADISVTPISYNFGDITVCTSDTQLFLVSNEGTANLQVTSSMITGADSIEFSIIGGGAPFTLAPGETHNIVAVFSPVSSGMKNADMKIFSNDLDENPFVVALAGNGVGLTNILGDVNMDSLANSTDALIILSFDAGLPLPQAILDRINIGFGDVNADGITNSTDALIILSYDVGVPIPFPVGNPVCLPNGSSRSSKFNVGDSERSTKH